MLLPPPQIDELSFWAYLSDKEVRSDLVSGHIRNEDDYTSNFTGALRRNVNTYAQTGLRAMSYLLEVSEERRTGCDATIIVSSPSASKVALFEAKAPGLCAGRPRWDYRQTSSGLSHFSDQLGRQAAVVPQFAVFEMFYCDYAFGSQPAYMHDEVSSCVWHDDAVAFDHGRATPQGVWSPADLVAMLQAGNVGVHEVLAAVCKCDAGRPIPMVAPGDVIAREFGLEGPVLHITSEEG